MAYNKAMKVMLLSTFLFLVSCSSIEVISDKFSSKPKDSKHILEVDKKLLEDHGHQNEPHKIITKVRDNSVKVQAYCKKMDRYFAKYKWGKSNCDNYSWHHVRDSHWGNPIVWYVYGDETKVKKQNTTMILCGVHGDEITPIKFCFDILEDLKNHPKLLKDNLVIIAPLVTPDSFFRKRPTRYNGRGVDVNRNFPTKDWNKNALRLWKQRYRSDKRRFPGKSAMSEQETYFQVNLIKRYAPNKIISVHAPLTLIDYDGPSSNDHDHGNLAEQLLIQMSDKAGKYRINNYPFFTGSLGNWAGNERKIPTYTLELPNSDWTKTKKFYDTFQLAIHHAISHEMSKKVDDKKVTETESAKSDNDKVL